MGVSRVCPGLLATALERSERQRSETPSRNFVSKFKFELRKNPPAPVGGEAWSSAKHSQHKFTVAFVGEKGLLFCLECRSYRSYQTFWKKDILDKNRGPHGEHVFLGNNLNIEWWPKNVYKYELQYSNADVWGLVEQMCGILNTLKQVNHKELTKKTPHLSRWRRPSSRFWLWERLPSQHAGKQLRCSTWEFTNGIFCGIFWIRSVGKIGHTFQHIPSDINIFQIHPCELFKSSHCFKNTAPNSFFLLNSVIKKFSESLI